MKKIDFHIHTVQTISDSNFIFDISKLCEYVQKSELDAIAITNHNIFDLSQYQSIIETLKITVFPGIEINFEGGHLLLIADTDELMDFSTKCSTVTDRIKLATDAISIKDLIAIFPNLGKYILIPHYDKNPQIPEHIINELSDFITSGEVNSAKKFIYCLNNSNSLVPVYFSDSRMSSDLCQFSNRNTFINCGDISLGAIKHCLKDKSKVSLSKNNNTLLQILDDGQEISMGLTVVVGERSSGKSYTLDRLRKATINPKYIRQFSLVERNEKDDEERFNRH